MTRNPGLLTQYIDLTYFQSLLKQAKDPIMIAFYQEAILARTHGLSLAMTTEYDDSL